MEKRNCKWCGKEFEPKDHEIFCSKKCYQEWKHEFDMNKYEERVCSECGTVFIPHHYKQKYCSKECAKSAKAKKEAQWRKKHPEAMRAFRRQDYYKHRDKRLAHNKEYLKKNYKQRSDYLKEYRRKNQDSISKYYQDHKQQFRADACCKRHGGFENCPYDQCLQLGKRGHKICPICGGEVIPPRVKYCSDECLKVVEKARRRRYYLNRCKRNDEARN